MQFKFLKWDKYNKRQKDIKRPFWFALSNDIFLDPFYVELDLTERQAFLYLLCEASRQNKYGEVEISEKLFCQITGFKKEYLNSVFCKLLKSGMAAGLRQDGGSFATATEQNRTEQDKRILGQAHARPDTEFNLEDIYQQYPKRLGNQRKSVGLKRLKALVSGEEDFKLALLAVSNYKKHCDNNSKTGTEFVKQFGSFFDSHGDWREWAAIDPNAKRKNDNEKLMALLKD